MLHFFFKEKDYNVLNSSLASLTQMQAADEKATNNRPCPQMSSILLCSPDGELGFLPRSKQRSP